jgi:asparagine synthase (glutamine-hydrolysing)
LRYGWNVVFQLEQIETLARRRGVELRHPFLDRRMVEFVLGLPDEQRHRAAGDRFILRHAMRGLMPERVRTRVGKSDLADVIDTELRTKHAAAVRELFRNSRLAAMGAVDAEELLVAFDRFIRGSRAVHPSDFETLAGFELWLRNLEKQ